MDKYTIGQALQTLRASRQVKIADLCKAINVSTSAYSKIEHEERDLTFLAGLRLCAFYELAPDEFAAMLSEQELERRDLSSIKALAKQAEIKKRKEQTTSGG